MDLRKSVLQSHRVGVVSVIEKTVYVSRFHYFTGIHDAYLITRFSDDRNVVAYIDHGIPSITLKLSHLAKDLILNDHIQCRGWLIGNDDVGIEGHCYRNNAALFHTPT